MFSLHRKKLFLKSFRFPRLFDKKQRIVFSVFFLSVLFFSATRLVNVTEGVVTALGLSVLAVAFLLWGVYTEFLQHKPYQCFVLPFLFTLSITLFSFLIPQRISTHLLLTLIFAIGIYALYLSENIFVVATERTIPLASSARSVSQIIVLVTYFFLSDSIFSLRLNLLLTMILFLIVTTGICVHAIWSYTLEEKIRTGLLWVCVLSACMLGFESVLWFWPTSPTITALFLSIILYVLTGLSHYWLDRRLFKNIIVEYLWVIVLGTFLLFSLTTWIG